MKNLSIISITFLIIISCINARNVDYAYDDNNADYDFNNDLGGGLPPYHEYAKVARYLVHNADWTAAGTNSAQFSGFPMVNVVSMADSAVDEKSTGLIYFYITDLDFTGKDLNADSKLTLLFTQEQALSCSSKGEDPMEPTCARVIVSGKREKLEKGTREFQFARKAMVSRHPAVKNWEKQHDFYLCKLQIEKVIVLDYYGGANYVTVEDYYKANYDWTTKDTIDNGSNSDDEDNNNRDIYINIDKDSQVKVIHIQI